MKFTSPLVPSKQPPWAFSTVVFFSETAACHEKHEFKLVKKGVRLSSGKLR